MHHALIAKALARFHDELGPMDPEFVDVVGPEELLEEARSLETAARDRSRLESILSQINNFAAVVALSNGFEPKVTGAVWGSLKIILMVSGKHTQFRTVQATHESLQSSYNAPTIRTMKS